MIVLVRHGETAWSAAGRHTGRTDIGLDPVGEQQARKLAEQLQGRHFDAVLSSPRRRARQTCELAGYGADAVVTDDLAEWDYGAYEGLTTVEIRQSIPEWSLWDDGVLAGETIAEVGVRADRVLDPYRSGATDVLVFSHGHLLRVLAARWLGLEPTEGRLLALDPATVGVLGQEHADPVIRLWNSVSFG
jgi:broad specificity phosphatase PhoE